MPPMQVFFAIHDVTPFHLDPLKRAETLFEKWGIEKVLYLLVPNYHGSRVTRIAIRHFAPGVSGSGPSRSNGVSMDISISSPGPRKASNDWSNTPAWSVPAAIRSAVLSRTKAEFRHLSAESLRDRLIQRP